MIRFALPESGRVGLKIFNVSGQRVQTLMDEVRPAGEYEVLWNAEGLPTGVYVCRLRAGGFVRMMKMVYQR